MKRCDMKQRLSVNIDGWLWEFLQKRCKKRGMKVNSWVTRAIIEKMLREKDLDEILLNSK